MVYKSCGDAQYAHLGWDRSVKVCIIRLVHIFKKNLRRLFDKYAVARTEHDALVKSTTKIFSNFVAFSENPNFTKLTIQI